jgi:integrase
VIELPESTKVVLSEHVRKFPTDTGLLFNASQGGPVLPNTFREKVWRPSLVRAGLDPSIRTHDLRHSVGSLLIHEGWSPVEVASVLGNSPAVVIRTYAHLLTDKPRSLSSAIQARDCVSSSVTDSTS